LSAVKLKTRNCNNVSMLLIVYHSNVTSVTRNDKKVTVIN